MARLGTEVQAGVVDPVVAEGLALLGLETEVVGLVGTLQGLGPVAPLMLIIVNFAVALAGTLPGMKMKGGAEEEVVELAQ